MLLLLLLLPLLRLRLSTRPVLRPAQGAGSLSAQHVSHLIKQQQQQQQ
jgi:hypothetical protein